MKSGLSDNLLLKILSVLAALILWLAVVNISDAEKTKDFMMEVTLTNTDVITGNGKVYWVEDNSNVVKLTVTARSSVMKNLSKNDFVLTADMEKDLKYDSLVGINVECRNKSINIANDVRLSRANVQVNIEDSASEQFPVTVKQLGDPASGYYVGSMIPEQTILKISGPVSIVNRIKRVEAEVDVTGRTGNETMNCKLKILDSDGQELDSAYLNYAGKESGIGVTVSLLNKKILPLKFDTTGTPAENYQVVEISSKPNTITVAGNQNLLSDVRELLVSSAVDIEGISEETQMIVNITEYLPAGIVLTDENDAMIVVTVKVERIEPETEEENTADDETSEDVSDETADSGQEDTDIRPGQEDTAEDSTGESSESENPEGDDPEGNNPEGNNPENNDPENSEQDNSN